MGASRRGISSVGRAGGERQLAALVRESEELESAPEIVSRFAALIRHDGFTSFMCLRWHPASLPNAESILATTRPDKWLVRYQDGELAGFDPVLREVLFAMRPFAWSDIARKRVLEETERRVLKQAEEYGMSDGFVVPVVDPGEHIGVVSLAGADCDLRPATRARMTLASLYFYNQLAVLRRRARLLVPSLSNREREILRWVAEGKSDWQIGRILGISSKTVNYHVERVKRRLGVATRTQAVLAALGAAERRG